MQVGDLVAPIAPTSLRSGYQCYSYAIVVSMEPFTLVSRHGDMIWAHTVFSDQFTVVRPAAEDEYNVAALRWRAHINKVDSPKSKTSVEFCTDVLHPCIQQRMKYNSGVAIDRINPMVGDFVLVYHDSELKVYMRVSERSWRMINGSPRALVVVLEAPCEQTHPAYAYAYYKFIETCSRTKKP